ncbi:MAG: rhomboid family intramembrane serine protease [Beijerinckiaceae bacterium]|nr:rhomboid family intramembrane serine protease [Beijerinckiaceae bacterium]
MIATNVVVYALSLRGAGGFTPRIETLVRFGAFTPSTLATHAYWRLFAAGFLHANPLHLAGNMLCLLIWGSLLETRIGALYFAVLYATCLLAGSLTSVETSPGAFAGVGASGAIAGIFGALIALTILGKTQLSAGFIVMNLLINIVLAVKGPGIDWRAHLGGLTAGLAGCAVLCEVTKASTLVFRCKFPEFVKINAAILIGLAGAAAWITGFAQLTTNDFAKAAIFAGGTMFFLKMIDLMLAARKGLLIVSTLFAILNTAAAAIAAQSEMRLWRATCDTFSSRRHLLPGLDFNPLHICPPPDAAVTLLCLAVLTATLLVYMEPALRGLRDVGFIGAGLMAEQKRSGGL